MSKPVLFSCFRPIERAENLKAIYEAYDGEKQLINYYDPDYYAEVTSGKYDLMVIDDFPSCTPGKTIVIEHSIQGAKTIGADQPGTPYFDRHVPDRITYIVSASFGAISMWESAAHVPAERIAPLGMPRTDQYIGKKKGDGHTVLSVRRAYLYVPTFRDRGEGKLPDIDWDYIDSHLTDDEVFAIKYHPWHTGRIQSTLDTSKYRHIIELSPADPTTPYLFDADVVITDYSSVMFDAYLLGKPVVLFEKEKGYTTTRGMYLQYPEQYCSRYAIDEAGLIYHIRAARQLRKTEKDCLKIVADMCDGHACERLCNLINLMKGG